MPVFKKAFSQKNMCKAKINETVGLMHNSKTINESSYALAHNSTSLKRPSCALAHNSRFVSGSSYAPAHNSTSLKGEVRSKIKFLK